MCITFFSAAMSPYFCNFMDVHDSGRQGSEVATLVKGRLLFFRKGLVSFMSGPSGSH